MIKCVYSFVDVQCMHDKIYFSMLTFCLLFAVNVDGTKHWCLAR